MGLGAARRPCAQRVGVGHTYATERTSTSGGASNPATSRGARGARLPKSTGYMAMATADGAQCDHGNGELAGACVMTRPADTPC